MRAAAVLWTVAVTLLGALTLAGCQELQGAALPTPVVPVSAPPSTSPTVTQAAGQPPTPVGVAPAALPWKRVLLQEIQFYWGMNQDPAILFAQVHQESRWRPEVSSKYAGGLAQFTPPTAEWIQGLYAADLKTLCPEKAGCPYDPRWALRSMVLYDKRIWDGWARAASGDDRWGFTLAAYNGGGGHLPKEQALCRDQSAVVGVAAGGCDPWRWFAHVARFCRRADWACTENRAYPPVILFKWAPVYRPWVSF